MNEDQKLILIKALLGESLFISGKAGTGKSYLTNEIVNALEAKNKSVVVLAPTGLSAANIGGETLHSFFRLPIGLCNDPSTKAIETIRAKVSYVDTFIIDEISMIRPDWLDYIAKAFGKKTFQWIFVGDEKQLPCVLSQNERIVLKQRYPNLSFKSSVFYQSLNIEEVVLQKVERCSDLEFLDNLNEVRDNDRLTPYFNRFIKPFYLTEGTILCTRKEQVLHYNNRFLEAIPTDLIKIEARNPDNIKQSDTNIPLLLDMKVGARIIYLKNVSSELYNGLQGTFLTKNGSFFIKTDAGKEIPLEEFRFDVKRYELVDVEETVKKKITSNNKMQYNEFVKITVKKLRLVVVGTFYQIPIDLAFALTIHKSQGMTLDNVTVDLTKPCFEENQLYVALSRVKNPTKLSILK